MTTINIDPDVIRGRRELLRQDAPCVGCGATLAFCEAQQGKDPKAPEWFGCCVIGTGMSPCEHRIDPSAQDRLMAEIEKDGVRSADEIRGERAARREKLAEQRKANTTPDGQVLDLAAKFAQGAWWRTKEGEWLRITEMSERHRRHSAAMLLRKAAGYAEMMAWGDLAMMTGIFGEAPEEVVDDVFREMDARDRDPEAWVRGTPLYRALLDGIEPA